MQARYDVIVMVCFDSQLIQNPNATSYLAFVASLASWKSYRPERHLKEPCLSLDEHALFNFAIRSSVIAKVPTMV